MASAEDETNVSSDVAGTEKALVLPGMRKQAVSVNMGGCRLRFSA